MPPPLRSFFRLSLLGAAGAATVFAATDVTPPPRPWEPDAFRPVTAMRIAALPAAEQPAWRDYWQNSEQLLRTLPPRQRATEGQAARRMDGPPIPATYSTRLPLSDPADARYATAEARRLADHVVAWQRPSGGWTKSGDYTRTPRPEDDHHDVWSAGTFDNDSTIDELRYLARVIHTGGDEPRGATWRESFSRGLTYVFAAQYPNGGWPQIFPLAGGYHDAVTYNDDAMVHILRLLHAIAGRNGEYAFVPAGLAAEAATRLERGIACVLATQLRDSAGRPTVWGQQHDALTLQPCAARNFEPVAECSFESAGLVMFLLTLPPSPGIIAAVDGAQAWFEARALRNTAWDRHATTGTGLVSAPDGSDLWARYYELGTGRPIFGERDRLVHYSVTELTLERRQGYGWYNNRASALRPLYTRWKAKLAAP